MPDFADLILENANVITGDPERAGAEAVAVRGGRILMAGSNREAADLKDRGTRTIDCQGKTVVPGFNDAHCHLFSLVRKLFSLDLSPGAVRSIEDIKRLIRNKVRYTPEGTWISGTDYNDFYLAEKRHPTRRDLDEAAPLHPIILSHRSLHACVLNSAALKLAGITNESEAPPGGVIGRDLETGEPNGVLYEMLGYIRGRIIPPITEAEMDWGFSEANRRFLALGITSLGEATVTNGLSQWRTFHRLKQDGLLKSRISMMIGPEALAEFKESGLATGAGDYNLRLGSLKIVLSQATGKLRPAQPELNQMVIEADGAGFQVAIHAIERKEVEAAVAALECARRNTGLERRHRIEHCSECPPALRRRLGRIQAVIVSQPPFIYYSGERYLSTVDPEAQKWLYPFKSLVDCGLTVAGSSDSPVVPNNPLMGMYAAVTRRAENGQEVLPAEAVSARRALEMYTRNAAYVTGEENVKGSLSPGQLADMAVLSANPLISGPEEIKNIAVEMTVLGGEVVYQA
jgi:predicted amidohydrolase YtcJ